MKNNFARIAFKNISVGEFLLTCAQAKSIRKRGGTILSLALLVNRWFVTPLYGCLCIFERYYSV